MRILLLLLFLSVSCGPLEEGGPSHWELEDEPLASTPDAGAALQADAKADSQADAGPVSCVCSRYAPGDRRLELSCSSGWAVAQRCPFEVDCTWGGTPNPVQFECGEGE